MNELQTKQFSVTILPPATVYHPVDGRKYTFIMSDHSSNRYLAIGYKYALNLLNVNREKEDVLTAEWRTELGEYILKGKMYLHEKEEDVFAIRKKCKQYEKMLPETISFLINADRLLYSHVPWLLDAPIYVEFNTLHRHFRTAQYMGTPRQYLNNIKTTPKNTGQ